MREKTSTRSRREIYITRNNSRRIG